MLDRMVQFDGVQSRYRPRMLVDSTEAPAGDPSTTTGTATTTTSLPAAPSSRPTFQTRADALARFNAGSAYWRNTLQHDPGDEPPVEPPVEAVEGFGRAPANPKTVEDVENFISEKLKGNFFGNVSTGSLEEITRKLESISPSERNEVIAKLSDDELRKWADEIGGAFGAISGQEKRKLYDMLAGSLDGDQLARVAKGLNAEAPEVGRNEFVDAVASKAPDITKREFVSAMAGDTGEDAKAEVARVNETLKGGLQGELEERYVNIKKGLDGEREFDPRSALNGNNPFPYSHDVKNRGPNGPTEALAMTTELSPTINEQAKKYGVPPALLAGVMAAEIDLDTPWPVKDRMNNNVGSLGICRVQPGEVENAVNYLKQNSADLRGVADVSGIDIAQLTSDEHLKSDAGSTEGAALMSLKLAHQMWSAGSAPGTKADGTSFKDFLGNMSAAQMAGVFGGYRNGPDGFNNYENFNAEQGVYTPNGSTEFANRAGDPRAVMGIDSYQSEPYFRHFLESGV